MERSRRPKGANGAEWTKDLKNKGVCKKILQVEQQKAGSFWCYSVKYMEEAGKYELGKKNKIDCKEVLDEETFARYAKLKDIRKAVAEEEQDLEL